MCEALVNATRYINWPTNFVKLQCFEIERYNVEYSSDIEHKLQFNYVQINWNTYETLSLSELYFSVNFFFQTSRGKSNFNYILYNWILYYILYKNWACVHKRVRVHAHITHARKLCSQLFLPLTHLFSNFFKNYYNVLKYISRTTAF